MPQQLLAFFQSYEHYLIKMHLQEFISLQTLYGIHTTMRP